MRLPLLLSLSVLGGDALGSISKDLLSLGPGVGQGASGIKSQAEAVKLPIDPRHCLECLLASVADANAKARGERIPILDLPGGGRLHVADESVGEFVSWHGWVL